MASIFEFVKDFSVELADLAARIEEKIFEEPQAALMQARLYNEEIVKLISEAEELETLYGLKHAERIHRLFRDNAIDEDLYMKFEWIRKKGNKAVHEVTDANVTDMLQAHRFLFDISVWYMQVYVSHTFKSPLYKVPVPMRSNTLNVAELEEFIKPYVDRKLDNMWADIQRQLEGVKAEKKADSTIPVTKAKRPLKLRFMNDVLLIPLEIADKPMNELPVTGSNYLLSELSRIGIDSLKELPDSLDTLHMNLIGIGTHSMEKFWEQLIQMTGTELITEQEQTGHTIQINDDVYSAFNDADFVVVNKTKKAAEFEHKLNKQIVYLLPNKQTTVVVHPETAASHFDLPEKPSYSTALRRFPKSGDNRKTPISYGYSFKFDDTEGLRQFLMNFSILSQMT
ncbi:DUF4145 domain-containing protein [Rossellomorea aquimaris]|uniref:DUF4145 domain-containing protein n=1 Tax=Rossellomorea aquimaris TaxID=189382 RepID=UPI001CD34EA9|nr:DUF4145 domain-containing protein [Rossellomorea aquimaris]MCA1055724.1 DUF4145 domain-containing protein [Rossellomorea aquimaris]